MTRNEDIALSEVGVTDSSNRQSQNVEPQVTEQHESDADQTSARQWESYRKRASVLVGSSVSQLPIWGFAMSYGVFQEYYTSNWTLKGNRDVTGIVGTTSNGVMYLSMPFLFALFTKRWARWRQTAALCGTVIACLSFLLSSYSTQVWHLVATQGVMAAIGCALIYSPMTLSLSEWFTTSNRAVALGVTLSCKNIVGSACPFLIRVLLDRYGFRITLRAWTGITALTSILSILLVPPHPSGLNTTTFSSDNNIHPRRSNLPLQFLHHRTFYIYAISIIFQSSGYGIPQTYLNTYAHSITHLSSTSATLLLTVFNAPGIIASTFFGYLSSNNNKHLRLSATTVSSIPPLSSALSTFLLWGLTSPSPSSSSDKQSLALLILFSLTFGFFAGGYSSTWGGILNELESEAAGRNEAIDTGMVYGLLNGARGIGYVGGGILGIPLLKVGAEMATRGGRFAYGTSYGPLIVFTGVSSVVGGWGLLWRCKGRGRAV